MHPAHFKMAVNVGLLLHGVSWTNAYRSLCMATWELALDSTYEYSSHINPRSL